MCRARYKFSYRARTAGAARCLPPDCKASVHSGNDLVQPCIGARRSVPMADSDGGPGRGGGVRLSVAPLPFRRDRSSSAPRSVHFRLEIGSLPRRDRAEASAGRHCPLESGASVRLWLLAPSTCTTFGGEQGAYACWKVFFSRRQRSGRSSLEPPTARPCSTAADASRILAQ